MIKITKFKTKIGNICKVENDQIINGEIKLIPIKMDQISPSIVHTNMDEVEWEKFKNKKVNSKFYQKFSING